MEDILGRELKVNDLLLGMTIGRNSDGIRFGVFNGTSVHWSKHNCRYITTSTVTNMYLLENPTKEELEVKQKIIDMVTKEKQEAEQKKATKKALKRIPTKELTVGESYEDDSGYRWVYLGKGTIADNYRNTTDQGYIYLSEFYNKYNSETDTFWCLPNVTVLKNPKKLVKVTEEKLTDYTFDKTEFTLKQPKEGSGYYGRRDKSLTFRLEVD